MSSRPYSQFIFPSSIHCPSSYPFLYTHTYDTYYQPTRDTTYFTFIIVSFSSSCNFPCCVLFAPHHAKNMLLVCTAGVPVSFYNTL